MTDEADPSGKEPKSASDFIGPIQAKSEPELAPETSPRRPRWRLVLAGLLALALIPHLYLLALWGLPVPGTLNMALQDGEVRRDWTRIEDVSPHLVRAVIGAEDSKFCAHSGIDWKATREQLDAARASGDRPRRGASTITQQTAKNVMFWNGGGYVRKAGEAYVATLIDTLWGKRRVMEVYLNVADWGDGLYGAQAAARARFGKDASDLSEREAALLAAVLPSPHKWRVDPPGPYVSGRAGTLQARARVVDSEGLANCVLGPDGDGD